MLTMSLAPQQFWFEYQNYQSSSRYLSLSQDEQKIVDYLNQEGFCFYYNALSLEDVDQINKALDVWIEEHHIALETSKKEDGTFPRLIGLDDEVPIIKALFEDKVVKQLETLIFGYRQSLHVTITFLQGSQQPLHRDVSVFQTPQESFFFRIWFALEDTTPDNGTFMGVKGGHKVLKALYQQKFKFSDAKEKFTEHDPILWRHRQDDLERAYYAAGLKIDTFEFSKGDALVWHPRFPHGGSLIKNRLQSRRAIVLHLSAASPLG